MKISALFVFLVLMTTTPLASASSHIVRRSTNSNLPSKALLKDDVEDRVRTPISRTRPSRKHDDSFEGSLPHYPEAPVTPFLELGVVVEGGPELPTAGGEEGGGEEGGGEEGGCEGAGCGPPTTGGEEGGCGCSGECGGPELLQIGLLATQIPANTFIPPAGGDIDSLGTMFIYNNFLYGETPDFVEGNVIGFVSGVCTRFQTADLQNDLAGGGQCDFTYTLDDGNVSGTVEASGEVFDILNSTLAILGGTEDFVGATGDIILTPVYQDLTQGIDVFRDAIWYELDFLIDLIAF